MSMQNWIEHIVNVDFIWMLWFTTHSTNVCLFSSPFSLARAHYDSFYCVHYSFSTSILSNLNRKYVGKKRMQITTSPSKCLFTWVTFFLSLRQNDKCLETRIYRWNFVCDIYLFFYKRQHFYVAWKSNQNGSFRLNGMKETKIPFPIMYTNIQYPNEDFSPVKILR